MADERYEWLDRDAAERLLRGESVETHDEHARMQAARLFEVLDGAADPGYRHDDGELPGEAAAMAAFRKARADAAAPAGDFLGTVRVNRPAVPVSGLRFGRPVRFGLAAAVAAVALGGVAVAAGTGVLPTPFGGDEHPLPASSVSAAETPGPLTSETPGATGGASSPPGVTTPPAPPSLGGASTGPSSGADGTGSGGPGDGGQATPGAGGLGTDAELRRDSVEACKDYRNGTLAAERRERLEELAKGADGVKRFCDRLLGPEKAGDGQGDGTGDGGTKDDGSGDGDGKGEDDRDAGGEDSGGSGSQEAEPVEVPPVSWTIVPQEPSATVSPTASAPGDTPASLTGSLL
ncbi:hypothetical protein HW130_31440 [Streptomyces sp. PKU-EA00015]|uniref:hypothetical protein n=1 Tax=Streptomyces sp. PKU-EA00015 TaxID=2748326 RepID=UPI0015A39C9C|nr:hypothetical protein [Streptomyces sp. PKU-EA00015]NWF30708.1 hypothetical protein [Streptomyces sp. PKU-EA00015]